MGSKVCKSKGKWNQQDNKSQLQAQANQVSDANSNNSPIQRIPPPLQQQSPSNYGMGQVPQGRSQYSQRNNYNQSIQNQFMPPPPQFLPMNNPKQTLIMNNDMYIRKDSMQFILSSNNTEFQLKFKFDALVKLRMQLYINCKEQIDPITKMSQNIHDQYYETGPYIDQTFEQLGQNQQFTSQKLNFDIFGSLQQLLDCKINERQFPLIIRLEKLAIQPVVLPMLNNNVQANPNLNKKFIFYYFSLKENKDKSNSNKYVLQLEQERLELNGESFEINSIFGLESSALVNKQAEVNDQDKECIICQTEKIDTVIMPCRHMCICFECAKLLSQDTKARSKDCPICRCKMESFLRLKRISLPPPAQQQRKPLLYKD